MDIIDSLYHAFCGCVPSIGATSTVIKLNTGTLKVLRLLGEGGFSYVYLVSDSSGKLYALKKIRCPFGEESVRLAMKEIEAYRLFDHTSIIKVIDHETKQEKDGSKIVFILLPYYKKGNLQDMINKNSVNQTFIPQNDILRMFRGICVSLQQLHEHKVSEPVESQVSLGNESMVPLMHEDNSISEETGDLVPYAHFDLKPANVMLSDDDRTVLMDFGSCKRARHVVSTRAQAYVQKNLRRGFFLADMIVFISRIRPPNNRQCHTEPQNYSIALQTVS